MGLARTLLAQTLENQLEVNLKIIESRMKMTLFDKDLLLNQNSTKMFELNIVSLSSNTEKPV
jgi:hypothetical protein